MAKKKFPSDANQPKPGAKKLAIKTAPKKEDVAQVAESTEVVGKALELVQIQYNRDNHHVLSGVHALRQGLNHIPKAIWDSVKENPFIKADIDAGVIVLATDSAQAEQEVEHEAGSDEDVQESGDTGGFEDEDFENQDGKAAE